MTAGFDIDEIERLLAAATPGDWGVCLYDAGDCDYYDHNGPCPSVQAESEDCAIVHWDGFKQKYWSSANGNQRQIEANAALIVTLHNSAPAMIAELRELRAENARLRNDKGTLLQFAQAIKTWRADANSYDRECGHTKRHYCEDVELMEKTAEYAMRRVGIRAALGEPQ